MVSPKCQHLIGNWLTKPVDTQRSIHITCVEIGNSEHSYTRCQHVKERTIDTVSKPSTISLQYAVNNKLKVIKFCFMMYHVFFKIGCV